MDKWLVMKKNNSKIWAPQNHLCKIWI